MISIREFLDYHVDYNDMDLVWTAFGRRFKRRGQAVKFAKKFWNGGK